MVARGGLLELLAPFYIKLANGRLPQACEDPLEPRDFCGKSLKTVG